MTTEGRSYTWIGNATAVLRCGAFAVLTEPRLSPARAAREPGQGPVEPAVKVPAMRVGELPPLDAVVLSHLHGDHFDRVARRGLDRRRRCLTTRPPRGGCAHGFDTRRHEHLGAGGVRPRRQRLAVGPCPACTRSLRWARLSPAVMGSLPRADRRGRRHHRVYVSGRHLGRRPPRRGTPQHPDVDVAVVHLGGTRVLAHTVTMDGPMFGFLRRVRPRRGCRCTTTTTASCVRSGRRRAPPPRGGSPTASTSYRARGTVRTGPTEWPIDIRRSAPAWRDIGMGTTSSHCRAARGDLRTTAWPGHLGRRAGDRFDDHGRTSTDADICTDGDQSVSDRANDVKERRGRRRAARCRTRPPRSRAPPRSALRRGRTARTGARGRPGGAAPGARPARRVRGQIEQQTQAQRDRLVELLRESRGRAAEHGPGRRPHARASELVREDADRLAGVRSYLERGASRSTTCALRTPQAGHLPSHRRRRRRPRRAGHPQRRGPRARPSRPAAGT